MQYLGGKLPFNQLPVLEVDGKFLSQSCTILKYVARETGWYDLSVYSCITFLVMKYVNKSLL